MAWPTNLHTFATNEFVRADWLQNAYDDVLDLVNPEILYNRATKDINTTANGGYASTTSSTFVDVSATEMRGKIIGTGRSLLVHANVVSYAGASGTIGKLTMLFDGVNLGDATHGLYTVVWSPQPVMFPIFHIINDVTPGQHELILQHRRSSGVDTIYTAIFSRHWFQIMEV